MSVSKFVAAVAVALSLAACSASQVSSVQSDVAVGCAVAQLVDGAAPPSVQAEVAVGCAVAPSVLKDVAPAVVTP